MGNAGTNSLGKKIFGLFLRFAIMLHELVFSPSPFSRLVFFPIVKSKEEFTDIFNRAHWYFPESGYSKPRVIIPVSREVSRIAGKVRPPESQENFLGEKADVEVVECDSPKAISLAASPGAILLWKEIRLFSLPGFPLSFGRTFLVDKNYSGVTESKNYVMAFNSTLSMKSRERIREISGNNFSRLASLVDGKARSYVFGTGPSLSDAISMDFSDGFRIVANTAINDAALMKHIMPHAVVFGDFAYHDGPSKYAAKFRKQMLNVCRSGCFAVTREDVMPFFIAHYPEIEDRIIGLRLDIFGQFRIPTASDLSVKLSNNTLVSFMLPLASSFTKEVFVIGCDGRKPGDKLFWSHAGKAHYDGLKQTVQDTHPSFFRDTDFQSYYEENCIATEKFIVAGEKHGREYISRTPSYIPALRKRYSGGA
ncbi:hypothetical protein HYU13_02610 [Candidatus Woesearchaeota archaeon]|nr:hypothetical protein [Candidatus Woesearchaeota archaeon]